MIRTIKRWQGSEATCSVQTRKAREMVVVAAVDQLRPNREQAEWQVFRSADSADSGTHLTTPSYGYTTGTHDPNYQTLAGIGGDVFGADKKAGGGGGGAAPGAPKPGAGGMAGESIVHNYCYNICRNDALLEEPANMLQLRRFRRARRSRQ